MLELRQYSIVPVQASRGAGSAELILRTQVRLRADRLGFVVLILTPVQLECTGYTPADLECVAIHILYVTLALCLRLVTE